MRHVRILLLGIICTVAFGGCAPTFRGEVEKRAKKAGFNKQEQLAAREYAHRFFGEKQENGTYVVIYSRLPLKEVTAQLDRFLRDIGELLSYNNKEVNKYVETFGLRDYFEREEKIYKAIRDRIRVAELSNIFDGLMGKPHHYSESDEFGWNHLKGYSPEILITNDLRAKYPFRSENIDEAKEYGFLREVERYVVSSRRDMSHKEPDPDYPDDPSKFIWVKEEYSIEIVKYKIIVPDDLPKDNDINYAEVYRLIEGERESAPAIKAFFNSSGHIVAVIDEDIETRSSGFGLPDFVERISENDLADKRMIKRIFPEDKNKKRIRPERKPIRVEIVKAGTEIDLWDRCPDSNGWKVAFTYRAAPENDNYAIGLKFKKREHGSGNSRLRQVEYITKSWTRNGKEGPGKVVEYYVPKNDYAKDISSAKVVLVDNMMKKLVFVFPDGVEKSGFVISNKNQFIKERPKAIAYSLGQKRYLIFDKNNDGKFEKRKEIAGASDDVGSSMDYSTGKSSYGYYRTPDISEKYTDTQN